jgi:hypothetical protein
MKFSYLKYKYTVLYTFICILLFIAIVVIWGSYITSNFFVYEGFDTTAYQLYREGDTNTPLTNHNVDLPINTTYQCKNICGPQSQCSITRTQCTSDVDCYGCVPPFVKPPNYVTKDVKGQNDAGRLIYNQNPRYSTLTTDIGTQATLYNKPNAKVPKPYYGIDNWMKSAEYGMQQFNKKWIARLKQDPEKTKNMITYPVRETATGLFEDNGPLPANAYLSI